MNPKVANIIAVELGILIAILAWLGFACHSGCESAFLDIPAETQLARMTLKLAVEELLDAAVTLPFEIHPAQYMGRL